MTKYEEYQQQLLAVQAECYRLQLMIKQAEAQLEMKERLAGQLAARIQAIDEERDAEKKKAGENNAAVQKIDEAALTRRQAIEALEVDKVTKQEKANEN